MYKYLVKTYNLLNSTHATVDLCVSVFSTDMHSSSFHVDFCADMNYLLSVLHKHHNLNNLGIRQEIWQNLELFGKIDFQIHSISVLKVFGKIDFHYAGEVTHPVCCHESMCRWELPSCNEWEGASMQ